MNIQDPAAPTTTFDSSRRQISRGRMLTVVGLTVVASAVVLGGLYTYKTTRDAAALARIRSNVPAPLAVTYEVVTPASIPQALTAVGTLAAINRVVVSAEVGGQVTNIAFEPGTAVTKGQLLAQLNDASERADLAALTAQLQLARTSLGRSKDLQQSGAGARAQLDQNQSQFEVVTANIARAEAAIAKKAIRAPFSGIIGIHQIDPGQYLSPGQGIAVLTDTTQLHVNFSVPEHARGQIYVGQKLSMRVDAFPDEKFDAVVMAIEPEVDELSRAFKVQAIADNADAKLMSGMFADLQVELPPLQAGLTVPETAVTYSTSGDSVFVANAGEEDSNGLSAHVVQIKSGTRLDGRIVVLEGLKAGDRVLTSGQIKLFEGARITLKDESTLVQPTDLTKH